MLAAFDCPHCGYKNHEIQSIGEIQPKGVRFEVNVSDKADRDRQVVRSSRATVIIPELEFEMPPSSEYGDINTIEGVLLRAAENLQAGQEARKLIDADTAAKVQAFIEKLNEHAENAAVKFTFILDDPTGNSYIEEFHTKEKHGALKESHYFRTDEQNLALGVGKVEDDSKEDASPENAEKKEGETQEEEDDDDVVAGNPKEVMALPEKCYACGLLGETKMVITDIPFFKQVVIMAFSCDQCGYKNSEVKSGGAIADRATRHTLKVTDKEDLNRDVLKSTTASIIVPDIDLEATAETLGGRFTTIEGLLRQVRDDLYEHNQFSIGDSATSDDKDKWTAFFNTFDEILSGSRPFTFILDDPASNSYLQNPFAPDEDPELLVEEYDRTFEQNEELGLNDMVTADQPAPAAEAPESVDPAVAHAEAPAEGNH